MGDSNKSRTAREWVLQIIYEHVKLFIQLIMKFNSEGHV